MEKHRLAYMISAYTEPKSLVALVEALDAEYVDFYIHIDRKVDIKPFLEPLENKENVFFTKERKKISWGGWSQVEMQYILIREIIDSPYTYQRVVHITGTDYPLVSNQKLLEQFDASEREYIIGYRLGTDLSNRKDKVLYYYEYDQGKYVRLFWAAIRKILKIKRFRTYESINYDIYFGSEYWALTYNTLEKLIGIWEKDKRLQKILRHASIPSEIWIHTLFFNSPIANKGVVFSRQYEGLSKLAPITYFEYGKVIKILSEEDWEQLQKSGKLFCKKGYCRKIRRANEKN